MERFRLLINYPASSIGMCNVYKDFENDKEAIEYAEDFIRKDEPTEVFVWKKDSAWRIIHVAKNGLQ